MSDLLMARAGAGDLVVLRLVTAGLVLAGADLLLFFLAESMSRIVSPGRGGSSLSALCNDHT